jgi:hypothetical protein
MAVNAGAVTASPSVSGAADTRRGPLPSRMLLLVVAIVVGELANLWNILAGYNGDKITVSWLSAHQSAWLPATAGPALLGIALVALLLAVCTLVRDRGATWATVALVTGGLGTAMWVVSAAVPMAARGMGTQTIVPAAQAQSLVDYLGKQAGGIDSGFQFPAFLLLLVMQIAVTGALIRSRAVPLWMPILFIVGAVVETVFASGGALTAVCTVPQIVAMVAIGWYAYRKSTA